MEKLVPGVRETVLVALREGDELGYEGGVYRVVAGGLSPAEFPLDGDCPPRSSQQLRASSEGLTLRLSSTVGSSSRRRLTPRASQFRVLQTQFAV